MCSSIRERTKLTVEAVTETEEGRFRVNEPGGCREKGTEKKAKHRWTSGGERGDTRPTSEEEGRKWLNSYLGRWLEGD